MSKIKYKILDWWNYMKNDPIAWMPIIVCVFIFGFIMLIKCLIN